MKNFIYFAFAICFSITATAQVSFQRLYDVVQDSTHILSDGIATNGGGFATLGSNIAVEGQTGIIHRAIFTTYDGKGEIQLAKDIYLADSTRLLGTSEIVQLDNGSFVMSANLEENDLSNCVFAVDGVSADPLWSRRIGDETQIKVSLSKFPNDDVLAGSTNAQEGFSIWLSRMNSMDGADVWAKEFTAQNEDGMVILSDLFDTHISDLDSNIIMTGQTALSQDNLGYHVTKVDKDGTVIWSTRIVGAPADHNYIPLKVTETADSSIYAIGRLTTATSLNMFLTKYDNTGEVVWCKSLTNSNTLFTTGTNIVPLGQNLAVSLQGTNDGLVTESSMMEIDTSGSILNVQVYRDSMSFFNLPFEGLSPTADGGVARFTNHFEQPLDFVSDIVKTGPDLQTPCSSSGSGMLNDVSFRSSRLIWMDNDFVDSDTLELDINNVNYYDVPTISPTPDQWCPNETIIDTLDATPSPLPDGVITYEWMGPGVNGNTNPFVVGMEEGEYMVTVTINDRHCYTLCDTVNITRLQEPTAEINPDFSQFCVDGTVNLIGNVNGALPIESFNWSTGQSDPSINVDTEATYTLTIVDACMETATASIDLTFPEQLESITISETVIEDCDDFLANLSVTTNVDGASDISYVWSDPDNITDIGNGTFNANAPGTYTVTVNYCGLTLTESITINSNPPSPSTVMVQANILNEDCENFSATLTAVTDTNDPRLSYVWSNGQTSNSIQVTDEEQYSVTVTLCGNESIGQGMAMGSETLGDLQFPKVFFPRGMEEENRTFGPVNPCGSEITNYTLKIYNRWGNEVFTSDDVNTEWDGMHGGSESASAVYVWVAEYDLDGVPIDEPQKGDVTLLR